MCFTGFGYSLLTALLGLFTLSSLLAWLLSPHYFDLVTLSPLLLALNYFGLVTLSSLLSVTWLLSPHCCSL